jgi:hypothetical protein
VSGEACAENIGLSSGFALQEAHTEQVVGHVSVPQSLVSRPEDSLAPPSTEMSSPLM